jgi:NADPH-dependent 2,4-dienoyl-CoA reductase/sulfur reductase-like enzyme
MRRAVSFDVVIAGAGPAGIAAACAIGEGATRRRVGVIDDNPGAGGQIWRGRAPNKSAARWIDRFQRCGCELMAGTTIIAAPRAGMLLAEDSSGEAEGGVEIGYERLILATGARERFLPFPGWTSPRVMGAGGLQAMVKGGMPIGGKSVVVAGSGPLLLAVAAALRSYGARILLVAEQSGWERLITFSRHLLSDWGKLRQALGIKGKLLGVPFRAGCWPVEAIDRGDSLRVRLRTAAAEMIELECDYLACGFFLVPNLELAMLLGCGIDECGVAANDWQETNVGGVYAAGEVSGIGGLEKSLIEGAIAGHAAAGGAGDRAAARRLFAARERARRFAAGLRRAFALREELKALARPQTLVCRCEDVAFERLAACGSMREAKLLTRCGMGACQGRVCGAACEFLFGWRDVSVRPPIFPAGVGSLV